MYMARYISYIYFSDSIKAFLEYVLNLFMNVVFNIPTLNEIYNNCLNATSLFIRIFNYCDPPFD